MTTLTNRSYATAPKTRAGLLQRLASALQLTKQRQDLATLSDAQLKDIGHTRAQAEAESKRAPWDVPAHWRL